MTVFERARPSPRPRPRVVPMTVRTPTNDEVAPAPRAPPPASQPAALERAPVSKDACQDTYEDHLPKKSAARGVVERGLDHVAPIRTHERVVTEMSGSVFGLEVGITLSQLELVRKNTKGVELIQVVSPDGSSNVELVLGRKHLSHNHRIELQGPALNTSVTPGDLPLGARFIGVGLTSDVTSAMDHDAVSYTAEVKLTTNSLLELAALGGPGAAAVAAEALKGTAGNAVGNVIADVVLGAVPVLSAALAFFSARRAVHVMRDKTAPKAMKAFAVAHAISDAVRVVFPLAGTLGNVALVGAAAAMGWVHMRHAKHDAPTGPRPRGTPIDPPPTTDAPPRVPNEPGGT